ncbi:helix-turn-helix domain-containing protein [Mycolicibacterium mageritense]|uniref:helix-turn-helix domain-containing protein n=1 Tax=Mycolicibacterium mageritense TaxID=53462 RepID=UPI001E44BA58|nr:helix-turn-helix domain-containing protein [Mycolicibacterium mageritense]
MNRCSQRGFPDASLEDVAVAARVTKGAVYHYFASKQALFQAVLVRVNGSARDGGNLCAFRIGNDRVGRRHQ